jgi:uncharacterized protein (TIGR02284 family)
MNSGTRGARRLSMNSIAPSALHVLDRLVHLSREISYETGIAAGHLRNPEVRAVLESAAEEHGAHARQLADFVGSGEHSWGDEGLAMPPHLPDWTDLARAVSRRDERGILEACAHAERVLLAAYNDAAQEPALGPEGAEVLREQAEAVAARHSLLYLCCNRVLAEA